MTRFTDGKKTVDIAMRVWEDGQYSPDWEKDFFEVGGLPFDEETETFRVQDVDYIIDQANDWHLGTGDYQDDLEGQPGHTPDDRCVDVDEVNKKSWYIIQDDTTSGAVIAEKKLNVTTREEAIAAAEREWNHLSAYDRKHCDQFFVGYAAEDGDGCIDYDTMFDIHYIKR